MPSSDESSDGPDYEEDGPAPGCQEGRRGWFVVQSAYGHYYLALVNN